MFFFLDTEFTDFKDIDLISLGIVSEDGEHEFYVELNDFNRGLSSHFVQQNIYPLLDFEKFGKKKLEAAQAYRDWLEALPDESLVIVADYYADVFLSNALLRLVEPMKKKSQYMMMDPFIKQLMRERGFNGPHLTGRALSLACRYRNKYYDKDKRVHHALVDAKANRHGIVEMLKEI